MSEAKRQEIAVRQVAELRKATSALDQPPTTEQVAHAIIAALREYGAVMLEEAAELRKKTSTEYRAAVDVDDAIYDLAKALGGSFARGEHSDAESIREAISRLKKPDDMLESAISLLKRAGESSDSFAPDANWWREYFTLTGEHAILTDEGWEPGAAKAEYRRYDADWQPLEEVNGAVQQIEVGQ